VIQALTPLRRLLLRGVFDAANPYAP